MRNGGEMLVSARRMTSDISSNVGAQECSYVGERIKWPFVTLLRRFDAQCVRAEATRTPENAPKPQVSSIPHLLVICNGARLRG